MGTNEEYLHILNITGIPLNEGIKDGKFKSIIINKQEMKIKLELSFPKIIEVENVGLLRKYLLDYFAKRYKKTEVVFTYDDYTIDQALLYKYYNYILSIFMVNKSRYGALEPLRKDFLNGDLYFYVANGDELDAIKPLLAEVNKVLHLYGLKSSCIVKISNFEISVDSIIKKVNEMSSERLKREIDSNNPEYKPAKNGKEIKKCPRMKNRLSGRVQPISLIPESEVQLIQYQQKHSECDFVILGQLIKKEIRSGQSRSDNRDYKLFQGVVYDGSDSIAISCFINLNNQNQVKFYEEDVNVGCKIRAYGFATYDRYKKDVILQIKEMQVEGQLKDEVGVDLSPVKRVELHAHTKMTTLDGVMDVEEYCKRASEYGCTALAVTDHMNIHAWPDFADAAKKYGLKPIFGVECEFVNDDEYKIALTDASYPLKDATYVVYDLETTGLSPNYDEIIEIGACKVKGGVIVDEFNKFVKAKTKLTDFTKDLTGISEEDLKDAESIDVVLPRFYKFIMGSILVAHNATFDNSFLYANLNKLKINYSSFPAIDTLQLFRVRYDKKVKKFGLDAMVKYFDIPLLQHHRAKDDAKATALCFIRMLSELLAQQITDYHDLNQIIDPEVAFKHAITHSATLLTLNETGKRNMYQLITDSHTTHFYNKKARIIKSVFLKHKDGLLIGSGLTDSEVFDIAHDKSYEELLKAIDFYDYIEIQPLELYEIINSEGDLAKTKRDIKKTILKIIKAAKERGKLVAATSNIYYLLKTDQKYRDIFISNPGLGGIFHRLLGSKVNPCFYYRPTDVMLKDFDFLDSASAYEIVITNTNKIADMVSLFPLFPEQGLFSPQDDFLSERNIPSVAKETERLTYLQAEAQYGKPLPKYIADRLKRELTSIISNKYAPIYYIAYMLVKYSTDSGYIVGSRGSVGSSLVAYMLGITEVNSLPPHYYCPDCHFFAVKLADAEKEAYPLDANQEALAADLRTVGTGFDLKERKCPVCGSLLKQNGIDIPFETFLGFAGDKIPDIDLNFSNDFQDKAHEFCRQVFGMEKAFRAGTISTIAEKTVFGFVKGYFERRQTEARKAEIDRLSEKLIGAKRTTGQHPGGIVVVPKEIEYYDITPLQYPADDTSSSWRTTHFDYHKFQNSLLKLDLLGQDDPTMIRHLMNYVETYPDEFPFFAVGDIPINDTDVLKLFSGLKSLNLTSDQTFNQTIGTAGIPEFGTLLSKEMLSEIRPDSVADLIKASGLSHGTDVWQGNAREFMLGKKANAPKVPFKELIGCRDDIMVYLISKSVPKKDAFEIMESVRHGRGVTAEQERLMRKQDVPNWYIESCKLIKYMFPKAHAAAYVIMALRIGWFKVHRPIFFYAGFFSIRSKAFDVQAMLAGEEAVKIRLNELKAKSETREITEKEKLLSITLLVALEMLARGMKFLPIDIFISDYHDFLVSPDRKSLLMPFGVISGLGKEIGKSIVDARCERMFTSKKDVKRRTKLTATQFETLNGLNAFKDLPESDQIKLF